MTQHKIPSTVYVFCGTLNDSYPLIRSRYFAYNFVVNVLKTPYCSRLRLGSDIVLNNV